MMHQNSVSFHDGEKKSERKVTEFRRKCRWKPKKIRRAEPIRKASLSQKVVNEKIPVRVQCKVHLAVQ